MSKELKQCPFCGEKPKIESWGDNPKSNRHWVGCYSRRCKKTFDGGLETSFFRTIALAVKAWNTRDGATGE